MKHLIESEESANKLGMSGQTISDTKKRSINYSTSEQHIVKVDIESLEMHPFNQSIYLSPTSQRIKALADNINENSLISKIIINKNNQILSGNMRYLALKLLNIKEIEVYMIDVKDELEFIISSNQFREKTIIDMRNEIEMLYEKYSPGQGSRDSSGEDTRKKVALITGYSLNKISLIRKINSIFPALLEEVSAGNMTMNIASKKADVIENIKIIESELGIDYSEDITVASIDSVFDKGVKSYCEKHNPEYYSMIKSGKMKTKDAFDKLLSKKTPKEVKPNDEDPIFGKADDSLLCPCCAQKVKKDNEKSDWLRKWNNSIREYIVNLPLNAA